VPGSAALRAFLPTALVLAAWTWAAAALLGRARPPASPEARRDPIARVGLAIQGVAFAIVFAFPRELEAEATAWGMALRWAGGALAWASALLAARSARALGRFWSLDARVLEDHRLVRAGPFAVVRHPIYVAMLGLIVGTALDRTRWWALAAALLLYLVGTRLRTRAEEALLTAKLGDEYRRYAAEVGGLVPRRWRPW
jgi:protein-S-isoprenylcysteine O-methyltransferase Ste14